ncbi:MAG: type II secretion system protein [Sumerlaeia bacterium]
MIHSSSSPQNGFRRSGLGALGRSSGLRVQRAFTLIEMLIVAALISLFSALAVINIQTQLENNRRKAIIGESRQIGTAMELAYTDLGFFPSIALLDRTVTSLELESERLFSGSDETLFGALHPYVLPTAPFVGTSNRSSSIERSKRDWAGAYISSAQTRSPVSSGQGGTRAMNVYQGISPNSPPIEWPLDGYNNPWMFYSLHIDRTNPASPFLYFVTETEADSNVANTSDGSVDGNYVNAIVSYGRNNVPGGGDLFVPFGDIDGVTADSPYGLRLYSGNQDNLTAVLNLYTAFTPGNPLRGDAGRRRANAWTAEFYSNAGYNVGDLSLSNDNSAAVGIIDPGSDDIVFSF